MSDRRYDEHDEEFAWQFAAFVGFLAIWAVIIAGVWWLVGVLL